MCSGIKVRGRPKQGHTLSNTQSTNMSIETPQMTPTLRETPIESPIETPARIDPDEDEFTELNELKRYFECFEK